ncbi:MAG: Holliday junction branch migration protein RuvA [Firmicutes bacterium]|nr:Holliday junction branch migration protein RuvA [Bacillota bacterium]
MFSYLKGIITELCESTVTLEAGGIGYELSASTQTLASYRIGDEVKLYTYMAVREDGVNLFGFGAKTEKAMFLRLTDISGVGPKVAMAVLSGLSVKSLSEAVALGDTATLSRIRGIGKKTAERIVLELRDKIAEEFGGAIAVGGDPLGAPPRVGTAASEAILALISLGFSKAEASASVARVAGAEGMGVEQIILLALKN